MWQKTTNQVFARNKSTNGLWNRSVWLYATDNSDHKAIVNVYKIYLFQRRAPFVCHFPFKIFDSVHFHSTIAAFAIDHSHQLPNISFPKHTEMSENIVLFWIDHRWEYRWIDGYTMCYILGTNYTQTITRLTWARPITRQFSIRLTRWINFRRKRREIFSSCFNTRRAE